MDTILTLDIEGAAGGKAQALTDAIRAAVTAGELSPGERLPPVRDLAFRLGVTPGTVARAYQRLTDAGLLEAHVGRGTFVSDVRPGHRAEQPPPGVLDLSRPGLPDVGQAAILRKALHHAAEAAAEDLLDYPDRAAGLPLREALATDLQRFAVGPCGPDDIALAHGGQHAYVLALQAILSGSAPTVAVEALSYPGFRHGARLVRAEAVGIEADDEGPLPSALSAACAASDVQVFVTSAYAQNPTTVQTSAARRAEIVAVARTHDIQIIEDECYGRPDATLPSYRALAPERTWHVGSLSKSFSPALRVGYLVAPAGRAGDAINASRHSSFGLARPLVAAAAEIVATGALARCRDAIDTAYAARGRILDDMLSGYAAAWRPGIPFAFLRLPRGWRASGFVRAAEDRGVLVRPADDFVLIDGRAPNAVRIALNARVPEDTFRQGIATLRALLDAPPHDIAV